MKQERFVKVGLVTGANKGLAWRWRVNWAQAA